MGESANPGYGAFQAKAVSRMGYRSISSKVQIPLKNLLIQSLFRNPFLKCLEIVLSLAATHNLTIPFRCQDIHSQRKLVSFITLHIERLDFSRPVSNNDGDVELHWQHSFITPAKVITTLRITCRFFPGRDIPKILFYLIQPGSYLSKPLINLRLSPFLCRTVLLLYRLPLSFNLLHFKPAGLLHLLQKGGGLSALQLLYGFCVGHPHKRLFCSILQRCQISFQNGKLLPALIQHCVDDCLYHRFGQIHIHRQVIESHLWLNHPELGQMTSRFRFFGTEGGSECIDQTVCHGQGLSIELARLSQISLFIKIVRFKECCTPFRSISCEYR